MAILHTVLSLWISGLLLLGLTGADELTSFPENFVVAKKENAEPVTLTCGTKTDGPVTWMFEDDEVDFDDVLIDGQNLKVSNVDTPLLGEYSCFRGRQKLSSVHLLMEAVEEEKLDSFLSCRAKSYDCEFFCNWNNTRYTAVRLGLGPNCSDGLSSCVWESRSSQIPIGEFQFVLSHNSSPYAEESAMFELTVEAIADLSFLRKTKKFYLRDIVQPDSPQIVRCQEVGQNLNVTIEPPSSWSTPHSFFSLDHEIQYKFQDDETIGHSSSALIPKGISKLRVRSRDSLVLSAWSQWTPWKNVIKNNLCRCKKRAKPCCLELPPGSLDRCKKGKGRNKGKKNKKHSS